MLLLHYDFGEVVMYHWPFGGMPNGTVRTANRTPGCVAAVQKAVDIDKNRGYHFLQLVDTFKKCVVDAPIRDASAVESGEAVVFLMDGHTALRRGNTYGGDGGYEVRLRTKTGSTLVDYREFLSITRQTSPFCLPVLPPCAVTDYNHGDHVDRFTFLLTALGRKYE